MNKTIYSVRKGMMINILLYSEQYFVYMRQVDLEGKDRYREKFLSFKDTGECNFMVVRAEDLPNTIDVLWGDGVWRVFLRGDMSLIPLEEKNDTVE